MSVPSVIFELGCLAMVAFSLGRICYLEGVKDGRLSAHDSPIRTKTDFKTDFKTASQADGETQ